MVDDVILNKVASMERCIKRIHEEAPHGYSDIADNYTKQDAVILNIQRLCELSIDLASYIVKQKQLGMPQGRRDLFNLLVKAKMVDEKLAEHLQNMVGFRNIAVHEYQQLNADILSAILQHHIQDFQRFAETMLTLN
jgi:uncharacterized protein YutE (UPF0331/DUF86 family)